MRRRAIAQRDRAQVAQSHRIRVQIGGLGAEAYSGTLSTETVEMGP